MARFESGSHDCAAQRIGLRYYTSSLSPQAAKTFLAVCGADFSLRTDFSRYTGRRPASSLRLAALWGRQSCGAAGREVTAPHSETNIPSARSISDPGPE